MIEAFILLFLFILKTTLTLPFIHYLNPFIPFLAVYMATTKPINKTILVFSEVIILNAFFISKFVFLLFNYLLIFPAFYLFKDTYFKSPAIKALFQGTLAIIFFYLIRFIVSPALYKELFLTMFYSEIFLLLILPFARSTK